MVGPLYFFSYGISQNRNMTFTTMCAAVLVVVVCGVAVFQLCLACGAPWGAYAFGGAHPGKLPLRYRVTSAFSLIIYGFQGAVFASMADLIPTWLPEALVTWILWMFVAFFALGTVMNGISRSKRERYLWTPIVALSFACALVVALSH